MHSTPPPFDFSIEEIQISDSATMALFLESAELKRKRNASGIDKICLFRMELFAAGLYDLEGGKFEDGVEFELSEFESAKLKSLLTLSKEESLAKQTSDVKAALRLIGERLDDKIIVKAKRNRLKKGIQIGIPDRDQLPVFAKPKVEKVYPT